MYAAKVVEYKPHRNGGPMVLPFLAERIGESGEAARPHADPEILALHDGSADALGIGMEHWQHLNRWLPLRSRPWRLQSVRQLWQVTVNLLEIHSQKADNGVAGHCSFGCGDFGPGRCFNADRGR